MKKFVILVFLVLVSASAGAQDYLYGLPMYRGPVSAMGACGAAAPRLWVTTDSTAAGNCAAGNGSVQVLCLCSGGAWAAIGSATLPQHIQDYSPDRKPATCYACEEFTDGSLSQTWAWGNQSSATETLELDAVRINYSGATGRTVRWLAAPAATDWSVTARIMAGFNAAGSNECLGVAILESGSIATPTSFREFLYNNNGVDAWRLYGLKLSSYSAYVSTDTTVWALDDRIPIYVQARYTTSTKGLVWAWSADGMTWTAAGSLTLAADPTYVGHLSCTAGSVGLVSFFRLRTDANRNLSGE